MGKARTGRHPVRPTAGGGTTVDERRLAVIPGDGIGEEVVREGLKILDTAAAIHGGFRFRYDHYPWSCRYYLEHGRMMPEDGLTILRDYEGIVLGAVGFPPVPDHVSLWGLLLPIRRTFDQYVNLRPVKLLRGITSPLRGKEPGDFDFVVIRENTEGEYSNMGGSLRTGTPQEIVVQNTIFTRYGVERIIRYAFELARARGKRSVVGATKSNGINYTMPFWDTVFREVARDYPEMTTHLYHVDALAAYFVTRPESFEVVVASNLFGDILTDLGGAIAGGIGLAPAANINPERRYPSMFEPVHGSAPDIAGRGIANPIGMIWTISLLLDHFGYGDLAAKVVEAVEDVTVAGIKTPDLGGRARTSEVGDAVAERLKALAEA
ncbi:MAG: tartrate dehydrogenase [Actinomycetia bacterium]|nr:tartrate dehydrogenase [Actinomycetes bacterium]